MRIPFAFEKYRVRLVLLVNLLLYAAYFVHLQADFPNGSPWNDFAKYTDEGWYGGAAVHRLQTGHWYVPGGFNPAVGLPAWPALLGAWFALTGPTIVAARALTVVLFGGSLLLLYALLRPLVSKLAAALAVTLILINPYCFSFDRLALLEPLVVFLFLLALRVATVPQDATVPRGRGSSSVPVVCTDLQSGTVLRGIAVGALLAGAVLTKTTAVVLAPAVLYQMGATAVGAWPAEDTRASSRLRRLWLYVAAHPTAACWAP